jgi:tRNA (guanine-N7-)-methyltransferase
MRDILDHTVGLHNQAGMGGFSTREEARPFTKFEQRGLKEGRESQFLHYIKTGDER